jgi:hypothetical protein
MKPATFFFSLVLATTLMAFNERPTLEADLQSVSEDGSPIYYFVPVSFHLVLNKRGERPTSFDFTEVSGPSGNENTEKTHYRVTQRKSLDCGSVLYVAQSRRFPKRSSSTLSVIDHSSRVCDDLKPAIWEVVEKSSKGGKRYFYGNPRPVGKDCSQVNAGTACIMLYAPATCTVSSYDGRPLNPPVVASASNLCFAAGAVRAAVCERGLDENLLQDDDVVCVSDFSICPTVMCAAPPEGCRYIPSDEKNEDGCLTYSCGVLVCDQQN